VDIGMDLLEDYAVLNENFILNKTLLPIVAILVFARSDYSQERVPVLKANLDYPEASHGHRCQKVYLKPSQGIENTVPTYLQG
jgi:hypothetical protein